ncbi:MAG: flagellar basal body rod protein FlgC [Melioribacteraceae bacterium]|nr:flagellar basal body rod protein FlgC [Melioribacteraceae bacterium]
MKIGNHLPGFKISAKGLSIQRQRMNLIAENIANAENTRTDKGEPYKRKFMVVSNNSNQMLKPFKAEEEILTLKTSSVEHMNSSFKTASAAVPGKEQIKLEVIEDSKDGEMIFMPNHPDADEKGYVKMSNVNVVQEMVEMIAATRSYEANITALNASKEMAKDSLEI